MNKSQMLRKLGTVLVGIAFAGWASSASARILFDDVTVDAGVDDTEETYGQAAADLNGDGCPDIWIDHHQFTPTVVLMNRCDGTLSFDQMVEWPGNAEGGVLGEYLRTTDTHGMGIADYDNDGDQDVHEISGASFFDLFWEQDDLGNFADIRESLGFIWPVDPDMCTTEARCRPTGRRSPMFFDYDFDGDLDSMITARGNHSAYDEPSAVFQQNTGPDGSAIFEYAGDTGINYQSLDFCAYSTMAELSGDDVLDVICADDSKLIKVWDIAQGVPFQEIGPETLGNAIYAGWPRDLAIGDFNGDGLNDVFAPSGASATDVVDTVGGQTIHAKVQTRTTLDDLMGFSFEAQGNVTFEFDWWTEVSDIFIGASGYNPPGNSDLQVNGSLHHVLFTLSSSDSANFGQPAIPDGVSLRGIWIWWDGSRWQVRASDPHGTGHAGIVARAAQSVSNLVGVGAILVGQPTNRSPKLYIQDQATGELVDSSNQVTVSSRSCLSAAAVDADNDGDLDLAVVCGGELSNLPNLLLDNDGNGNFTEVPNAGADAGGGYSGFAGQMPLGRGQAVITADFDLDGRVDTLVTNGHPFRPFSYAGRTQVFRNSSDTGYNWVQFDLEGTDSNRDAIGARIFATTSGGTQHREIGNEIHKYTQNFRRVHFGLGQNTEVNIEIRWPNGLVDTHEGLGVNQFYHCTEGGECVPAFDQLESNLSVADVTVNEDAGVAEFVVTLSPANNDAEVTVEYVTADGTAVAGADYTAVSSPPLLTFAPGETQQTVTVPIIDDAEENEGNETFSLMLENPVNAQISADSATGTIVDNDGFSPPVCGQPSYNSATESAVFLWNDCADPQQWHVRVTAGGQPLTYRGNVSSDQLFDSLAGVSIEASDQLTADFGTPTAGPIDFVLRVGNNGWDGFDFHFPAGANTCFDLTSPALPVWIGADRDAVTVPVNLTTFGPCAEASTLSVANVIVDEGAGSAVFTVNLSPAPGSGEQVDVSYATSDGTAQADADYTAAFGAFSFTEGQTQQTVTVPILEDTEEESDETFVLALTSATTNSPTATGTIVDNDGGSTPTCGEPTYSPATESAVFLWQDCDDPQQWHVRVTAGGQPLTYRGNVTSDQLFDSLAGVSIEASDELTADFGTPTAGPIDFVLRVGNTGWDGFDVHFPAGSNTCFDLTSPDLPVWMGQNRVAVTVPINLATLGACTP